MVSDTIGDLIIRLKNAGVVKKSTVEVPFSKLRHSVLEKLVAAGFVTSVEVVGEAPKQNLVVTLHYKEEGNHAISGVKRISKPGRRIYKKVTEIYPVKFGHGKAIMSTPAGILTGEEAREKQVGGEQLFLIW